MNNIFQKFYYILSAKTKQSEHYFFLYGLLTSMGFLVFYFIGGEHSTDPFNENLILRIIASVLSLFLMLHRLWPQKLKPCLPFFWYITLFYNLPFFFTYMFLKNSDMVLWHLNALMALVVLTILTDWKSVIIVGTLGISAATLFYLHNHDKLYLPSDIEGIFLSYITILIYITAYIFNKDKVNKEKVETYKAIAGSIAHEMRTPLATINMGVDTLQGQLPDYVSVYQQAKESGLQVPALRPQLIERTLERFVKVANQAHFIIDMLLMKLRDTPEATTFKPLSIQACVDEALQTYPFTEAQRKLVHWENPHEFTFQGHGESFTYVLYNLLKNALHHLQRKEGGELFLWTAEEPDWHVLYFKDTGPGIPKDQLPRIFDRFYTQTQHGTGLGLAFCQQVMHSFGGQIKCDSDYGHHTTFILGFPKRPL